MHQPIRRWLRVALWIVPLLALGAWISGLPIWPAGSVEGGYGLLCSAAAAIVHVAQSAVAPTQPPAPAAPAAGAADPVGAGPEPDPDGAGMPPVLNPRTSTVRPAPIC